MGGNGSYSKSHGAVPRSKRTHTDTSLKIGGHKVLLQSAVKEQTKNVLNSNSANPIYLIAKKNPDGTLTVHDINVFKGHRLSVEINLKFDSHGKLLPYNSKKPSIGSHMHKWKVNEKGDVVRADKKAHDRIPVKYERLIKKIMKFNNKHKTYHGKH